MIWEEDNFFFGMKMKKMKVFIKCFTCESQRCLQPAL